MAEPGGFPRRFDQYVLLKPLARGGTGELYLAASGARGMEKLGLRTRVDIVRSAAGRGWLPS